MGRFRYRMESILNIKLKMEEQAKMSYSLAQLALNEEEEKLAGLYQRQAFIWKKADSFEKACWM